MAGQLPLVPRRENPRDPTLRLCALVVSEALQKQRVQLERRPLGRSMAKKEMEEDSAECVVVFFKQKTAYEIRLSIVD